MCVCVFLSHFSCCLKIVFNIKETASLSVYSTQSRSSFHSTKILDVELNLAKCISRFFGSTWNWHELALCYITIHNMWFDDLLWCLYMFGRFLKSAAKVIAKLSWIYWWKFDTGRQCWLWWLYDIISFCLMHAHIIQAHKFSFFDSILGVPLVGLIIQFHQWRSPDNKEWKWQS